MTPKIPELYDKNAVLLKPLVSEIKNSIKKGDTVIDLGCGTGLYIEQLKQKVGKKGRVIAVDLDASMVKHCKRKFADENVVIKKLAAEELSKIKEKADVIFASLSLQFTKAEKSVSEIRKVLKDSGELIFAIPLYRTGINKSLDDKSRKFKEEFYKNLNGELKKRGIKTAVSAAYPNKRAKLFSKIIKKSGFKVLKWEIAPFDGSDLKGMLNYYKVPWRSNKIMKIKFSKRYEILSNALKQTFSKYPKFRVMRYYLIAVARKK